jgi:hypothetical protein
VKRCTASQGRPSRSRARAPRGTRARAAETIEARSALALPILLAGTSPAACTVTASAHEQNPVGSHHTAGLSADVASYVQAMAWETSQGFHARDGQGSL